MKPLFLDFNCSQAARVDRDWLAIRVSYGMAGVVMQSADLPTFAAYLVQHQARRPPDHLIVEWFGGETEQRWAPDISTVQCIFPPYSIRPAFELCSFALAVSMRSGCASLCSWLTHLLFSVVFSLFALRLVVLSKEYKNGRAHLAFRYNMLDHHGSVSTLRRTRMDKFPHCFEPLVFPVLFQVQNVDDAVCCLFSLLLDGFVPHMQQVVCRCS